MNARSLTVTAWLQAGAVLDETWPQTLDGVLGSIDHRSRLADRYGHAADHHHPDLPLMKASKSRYWGHGTGGQWWFHASCATPVDWDGEPIDETSIDWWHKRPVHVAAMRRGVPVSTSMLNGHVGRYRAWRQPEVVSVCAAVRWRCVGDPELLEPWCRRITHVGKGRSKGNGVVTRVEITDDGEPDPLWAVWRYDGRIARPVPARCAERLGVQGCDTVQAAIRPPYWRPPQTTQPEGGFRREWRTVIAPWTARP